MKHHAAKLTAFLLALTLLLGACSVPLKEEHDDEGKNSRHTEADASHGTKAPSLTPGEEQGSEEDPEPLRKDLITRLPAWQEHLANVIKEKQLSLGRPAFTLDLINRVTGMGLVQARDLDGDDQEELIFVTPYMTEGGYYDYRLEIWNSRKSGAECIFEGIAYRMGVDNIGLAFWEGEDGGLFFLYDDTDSMNGRYLGRIRKGAFEAVATLDWSQVTYDNDLRLYTYEGKKYRPLEILTVYCYSGGKETEEYLHWKNAVKESYADTLRTLGLVQEDGPVLFTPGLTGLADGKYLRLQVTYKDPEGNITAVWDYDYDEAGHEIFSYRNDVMRSAAFYNEAGVLVHDITYRSNGIRSEENFYNDNGDLLEKTTYQEDGRSVNWHYVYTYDEKGRMASASMGIGGLKLYTYNDDDVMIEARTVDPSTGELMNSHSFVLDEKGRHLEEYLNKDGMSLKYQTWEYYEDGSYTEILWDYQHYDSDVHKYYLEGQEVPGTVTEYDTEGRILRQTVYAFVDYGRTEQAVHSIEEYTYDENGHVLTHRQATHNNGTISYEEKTVSEYTADGQLKHRDIYYHNYGYWSHLGETEHEISFTNYEADFNELGYRIHVITRKNDDPYGSGETVQNNEMFILYENAYGEIMGLKP